jgi:DNA-binding MarR family transcriptional regulator
LSGLSEQLQIGSRSVTEIVDGLEAKGLVERRPDPQDREATLVAVTEHGIQVGQAIRSAPAAAIEITE